MDIAESTVLLLFLIRSATHNRYGTIDSKYRRSRNFWRVLEDTH